MQNNFEKPKGEGLTHDPIQEKRKVPASQEERASAQAALIEFCKKALRNESLSGLNAFIRSFGDSHIERQIQTWLQQFSPIQVRINKNGRPMYERKINLSESYDISRAHLDPYYSIDIKPEKVVQRVSISHIAATKSSSVSDAEFLRRNIRNMLELVLKVPTEANKRKLINMIRFYETPKRHGPPLLQGGSPGLGKRK